MASGGPISLEFDDGLRIPDCQQYAELQHSFYLPGVHILTAQCKAAGNPITAKIKVVPDRLSVGRDGGSVRQSVKPNAPCGYGA